ncbi:unnamed protein product [Ambrosiozyma monospora]|uniref:Unnamed protein product n=1 Tax=Ambrosiozyma monospora TaxID=43982 RepID=A0ACB5U902_AMBMO|nr:unnamed protein product [Ambrosiozyma monospora]
MEIRQAAVACVDVAAVVVAPLEFEFDVDDEFVVVFELELESEDAVVVAVVVEGSGNLLNKSPKVTPGSLEANILKLGSLNFGTFHGNFLSVIQQYIMAADQISTGLGSYLLKTQTSGAKYGSEPTIP